MADQIEEVKQKTDIVALIGEYIEVKKAGRNYKAICPFHSEKTPSFMISPELQIYKCFGCFPAGQLVKTPFGYHEIQDIVDNECVISGSGVIRKVLTTHSRNYKGGLISIKLSQLTEPVSLTSNHLVYVVGGARLYSQHYKYLSKRLNFYKKYSEENRQRLILKYFPIQKVNAGALEKGMSLLYPVNTIVRDVEEIDLSKYITKKWPAHGKRPLVPQLEVKIDEDFLKLIGYYIAEGSSHRAYIRFSLGDHEKEFAKEIVRIIKRLFNIEAKVCRKHGGEKTGTEISACNSILANIFENLCGRGAQNKHIPFVFQQLPKDKEFVLLNAIYKGDGFQNKLDSRTKTHRRAITTISRTLSEQLTDILLRGGYYPSRYIQTEKIDGTGVNHKKTFTVGWSVNPGVSKHHHLYKTREGSLYWILPILEVSKKRFSGRVYNLTVDEDHSYVANNFAVANCGAAGDVFSFLKEYEGMEFGEALKFLADRAGVKLIPLKGRETGEKEKLYEINNFTNKFYQYFLLNHPIGKVALSYLLKERGLKMETIKEFQLGYSPDNPIALKKFLIDKKKFFGKDIEKAGIGYPKGGYFIDRLRGRVIFPLFDHRGNVVGFAGRVLPGPNEKETAKYINTPETPVYHKGSLLYALNITKQNIKRKETVIIVEGELDAISSYQAGIKNVVAIKGSALTEDQVRLISRFSKRAILCLDSDIAGDAAARRGVIVAQDQGLDVKVAQIEGFKDPDEAARNGLDAYKKALMEAKPIWDFLVDSVFARFNGKTGEGMAKISREVVPVLSLISDKIVQDHYVGVVAKRLGVSVEAVEEQLGKVKGEEKKETGFSKKEEVGGRRELLEERLLSLGFRYNPEILVAKGISGLIATPLAKRILDEYMVFLAKNKKFDFSEFGKSLPKELFDGYAEMVLSEDLELKEATDAPLEIAIVQHELKVLSVKEKMTKISDEMKVCEEKEEKDKLKKLGKEFNKLKEKLHSLEEKGAQGIILEED